MRDRREDLGRILVLAEKLSDHSLFDEKYWYRPKDACDWFEQQDKEKKADVINGIAYGIDTVYSQICEIISIARGQDDLSENTK